MTTLTITLQSAGDAHAIAETLLGRGFGAADVAVFGGAPDGEAGDDEAALAQHLQTWAIDPDAAAAKAAEIAAGAVIVAVRTTDENREVALAILEGRGDNPVNALRAGDETAAADLNDLDGQTVRATSG